jgi:hypothetical protein
MTGSGHPDTRPTAAVLLERICLFVIATFWVPNLLVNAEMGGGSIYKVYIPYDSISCDQNLISSNLWNY